MGSIFKKPQNTQARLKMGIYGFEGSGKTFTASLYMIGLHKFSGSDKPVAFFDTETGSDFIKPLFEEANIELITAKAQNLKTLHDGIMEAERECFGLIVDSITHIYKEVCSTYIKHKKDGTNFIRMQDWGPIKETWRNYFSTPYVNSNIHIIWCSRAKNIFEDVLDDLASSQTGREQFKSQIVGTGARSETESAHEPSILIEMQRRMEKGSDRFTRNVIIMKERFNIIDGETFTYSKMTNEQALKENKPFMDIMPHIQRLNLAGEHIGFNPGNSKLLFDDQFDEGLSLIRRRRTIAIENIQDRLVAIYPAGTGKDKQAKLNILDHLFKTTSWTEIKLSKVDKLESAAKKIKEIKNIFDKEGISHDKDVIKDLCLNAELDDVKEDIETDLPQECQDFVQEIQDAEATNQIQEQRNDNIEDKGNAAQ